MQKTLDWGGFCPTCGARSSECDGQHPKEEKMFLSHRLATDSRSDDLGLSGLNFADLYLPDRPEKAPLAIRLKGVLVSIAEFFSNHTLLLLLASSVVMSLLFMLSFLVSGLTIGYSMFLSIPMGGYVGTFIFFTLTDLLRDWVKNNIGARGAR